MNIAFISAASSRIERFLMLAEDMGGYQPRLVRFYTATGRAQVKPGGPLPQARSRLLVREAGRPAQ